MLVSGGGTALDAGWPSTRLAVETGTTSGQSEVPSVRPLQHSYSVIGYRSIWGYIEWYSEHVNICPRDKWVILSDWLVWCRPCVVTVLQGLHCPGLAAPSTSTLAPQHRHNTNLTLLIQLANNQLNVKYFHSNLKDSWSDPHDAWHYGNILKDYIPRIKD